jgi:hypothetical protein
LYRKEAYLAHSFGGWKFKMEWSPSVQPLVRTLWLYHSMSDGIIARAFARNRVQSHGKTGHQRPGRGQDFSF